MVAEEFGKSVRSIESAPREAHSEHSRHLMSMKRPSLNTPHSGGFAWSWTKWKPAVLGGAATLTPALSRWAGEGVMQVLLAEVEEPKTPSPASREMAVQVPSLTCGRWQPRSPLPPAGEGQGEGSCLNHPPCRPRNNKAPSCERGQVLDLTGAGERSRTLDLLITNELLYQLSYTGEAPKYRGPGVVRGPLGDSGSRARLRSSSRASRSRVGAVRRVRCRGCVAGRWWPRRRLARR